MWSDFHLDNILLKEGRKDNASDTLILHKILEHYVINGISYYHRAIILKVRFCNNPQS